ncbi:TPA: hypothetical protein ACXPYA_004380 [Klebsiella variicola subsp. variicola]
MTKSTITREQATDKEIQMLIDSHENGTAMFLRVDAYYLMAKELQEIRKTMLRATELLAAVVPADRDSVIETIGRLRVVISGDYSDE